MINNTINDANIVTLPKIFINDKAGFCNEAGIESIAYPWDGNAYDKFCTEINDKGLVCSDQNIVKGKKVITTGLANCVGGVSDAVTNNEESCAFHYSDLDEKRLDDIYENAKKLKKIENDKLYTFITGTDSWSKRNLERVLNKIKEITNFMIIGVQTDGGCTNVYHNASTKTFVLNHYGGIDINSLEDVNKVYKMFEIPKGVEVWIKGLRKI